VSDVSSSPWKSQTSHHKANFPIAQTPSRINFVFNVMFRYFWFIIQQVGWEGVDWMHLAQGMDMWRALVNTVMNLQVLCKAEFLEKLTDC